MNRPFLTTLVHDCPAGVLDLQLRFLDPLSTGQKVGWQDVLKTFVDAANSGALSGAAIAPAVSGCILEHEALLDLEGSWRLGKTVLDPGALTVLLNLCHWGHLNVSRIERLVLSWERCPKHWVTDRVEFPSVRSKLSFARRDYELVGQTVAIDIDFVERQPADKREQINDVIGHWFKAANWGGYADENFPVPVSTVIIAPEPMTTDSHGISWYVEGFYCSEKVIDGLLNCLDRISSNEVPIERVTIGE